MNQVKHTFSDSIAGYVTERDRDRQTFRLKTSADDEYEVKLSSTTAAELLRNTNEPYHDCTSTCWDMLTPGRFLFVYAIWYPESDGYSIEAKRIIFLGRSEAAFRFEEPDWWVRQIGSLADFFVTAQFEEGEIDFRRYRTVLSSGGLKTDDRRQETDTISRLVYGLATAYMLTGVDRYLDVAEKGAEYLRRRMCFVDTTEGTAYWYHAIELEEGRGRDRKIFASEFGDDNDAIPMYEQIYALAGLTQTYRVTGDQRLLNDIEMTMALFDKYFLDRAQGGYFSHIDPVTLDPRSDALGPNRARKNWNSVGDHAPAYLISLWLATAEDRHADMLASLADLITEHFPDDEHSPFVQERFHEDWSADRTWGWQQDRAVVGHNLKIAWNLMRINNVRPRPQYVELAQKIAATMPAVGSDQQRGGWYDVVERTLAPGQGLHLFVWHDRKAWWQQEQAILAYLILAGSLQQPQHLSLARESAAFYNAFFPDPEDGGIYFNVLASGVPYVSGIERLKASHSMSGYHAFELAYLAAVYTNLLITRQPLDLYFKPQPGAFKDGLLRVAPDALPAGSTSIGQVWINDAPYEDFDAAAMTVRLPSGQEQLRVKVQLVPALRRERFEATLNVSDGEAELVISGDVDVVAVPAFRAAIDGAVARHPKRLVLRMDRVTHLSATGVRALIFASQKMATDVELEVVGANQEVRRALEEARFASTIFFAPSGATPE